MENIFLKILNMSITAGWLVLAVLIMRLLLRKAPRYLSVIMWALVGLRLVLPFTFESAFSLIPSAETVPPEILYEKVPEIHSGIGVVNGTVNPVISESFAPAPGASVNPLQVITLLAGWVWVIGMAIMVIYSLVSYLRIRHKTREAALLRENIWVCDSIDTPFILGIFRPRIFLPSSMAASDIPYVVAHEQAHLKRKDHLWKPLGFLLLTIHWFNPLLWVAYILLCRDIETACDEKVLKTMGEEVKAPYSHALINCSVPRRAVAACPLAFGEVSVKSRIKNILSYKKPAFWLLIAAVVVCIVLSVCFLTNPTTVNEKMQVFLDCQIAERHQSDHSVGNACVLDYEILGVKKKGKETTVYMWVLYEEYSMENGRLEQASGAHTPTVVTAEKADGNYHLVEYWEPRDGGYYTDDIRAKFPWYLWGKALDSQRYIDRQQKACRELAEEYFKENAYTTPNGSVIHIPDQSVDYDDLGLNMDLLWEDGGTLNAVFHYAPTSNQAGFPTTTQEYQLYAIHEGKRWPFEDYVRKVLGQDYPAREPVTDWTIYTIKAGEQTVVPIDLRELGMELPPGPYELVKEVSLQVGDTRYKKEYSVSFAILDSALTDPNSAQTELEDQLAQMQHEVTMLRLQEKYPQYFGLSTVKGLEVYVWQMAGDSYSWSLMPGKNLAYTWSDFLELPPLTLAEIRLIVASYDLPRDQISIIPIIMPHSSYHYPIDDTYQKHVEQLFWSSDDWGLTVSPLWENNYVLNMVFHYQPPEGAPTGELTTTSDYDLYVIHDEKRWPFEDYVRKVLGMDYPATEPTTQRTTYTISPNESLFVPIYLNDLKLPSAIYEVVKEVQLRTDEGILVREYSVQFAVLVDPPQGFNRETVSYAGGGSEDLAGIWTESLNLNKLTLSSETHLPVLKFETLEELEQFKEKYAYVLSAAEEGWDDVPSFNAVSAQYDAAFFEDNILVLVYVPCGNCTHRFDVLHVFSGRDSLSIRIFETTGAEVVADAEANWFITIPLYRDSLSEYLTEYDAMLVSP